MLEYLTTATDQKRTVVPDFKTKELRPLFVTTTYIRLLQLAIIPLVIFGCGNKSDGQSNSKPSEGDFVFFNHPVLGELYPEDVDWCTDEADVSFHESPVQVCLANGSEDGPSDSANAGYNWIAGNWREVLQTIEQQAFEFYRPYADAVTAVPRFAHPSDLWGTERLLSLRIFAAGDFTVTLRFDWQDPSDPHEITFYVEGGACITHTADG